MPAEIRSLRWRRFIAKYVTYLEIFAYAMVVIVGTALIVAWTYRVDVTADSKDGNLKALEHDIKAANECVVLRLPVPDKAKVKKGQVVAEVCTDPEYVKSHQAMERLKAALETLKPAEPAESESNQEGENGETGQGQAASPTVSPAHAVLIKKLEAELAAWDAANTPEGEAVTATADGMLWLGSCTTGTVCAADKTLFGIRDFNVLQVAVTFEAANAHACRPGLPGFVEINAEQSYETLVRLNTDDSWVPFVGSRLSQFTTVADEEIRDTITKSVKNRLLLDADKAKTDDFPLPAKTFSNITVRVSADLGKGALPAGKAPTTTALRSQDFRTVRHDAVCIKGKHLADIKLLNVDVGAAAPKYVKPKKKGPKAEGGAATATATVQTASAKSGGAGTGTASGAAATTTAAAEVDSAPDTRTPMEKIQDLLRRELFDRPIEAGGDKFHVTGDPDRVVVNVKLTAEMGEEDWDLEKKPKGYAKDELPDVDERSDDEGSGEVKLQKRKFSGTLQLVDPDPHLKAEVERLARDGKALKVKAKLVVRRTPFAMMLFRKH